MRHLLLTISTTILIPLLAFSQTNVTKWLTRKFKTADTVLLISHQLVYGATDDIVDKEGHSITLPKLIVNGRLNKEVVKEELRITGTDVDTLLQILSRPDTDSIISQGGCFVSRQSIIILKNYKTSFIDICFHCGSYETSKDLGDIPLFDHRRWVELENYFRAHGLTYELDKRN